jgi:hypothetical protein
LSTPKPLAADRRFEDLEARDIATWPCLAGDKSAADCVHDLGEHDRDRAGQPLKLGQGRTAQGHDHIRCRTDHFGSRGLYPFRIARVLAILDPDVAALGPAQLLENIEERRDARLTFSIGLREGRHLHADPPGLLRTGRERPSSRRTAEKRHELPTLQRDPSS